MFQLTGGVRLGFYQEKEGLPMSTTVSVSLIVAVIIVAAVIVWYFRAEKKASHHVDEVHIAPPGEEKE